MSVSFRDKDGTTRLDGDLLASGGATGDVLTQQADGTYAPAAGGGSPDAVTLLGPQAVNFNTANFVNPSDNGVITLAIPAGTVVDAFCIVTADFAGYAPGDELDLILAGSGGASNFPLARYDTNNLSTNATNLTEPSAFVDTGSLQRRRGLAVGACSVYASFFAAGPITAGSIDVYAYIATPI